MENVATLEPVTECLSFEFSKHWKTDNKPVAKGKEIVVDLFCGGGGASVGIEAAIGTAVDVAINHSSDAIYYHEKNHPSTTHHQTDVFDVHPVGVTRGRKVGLLWLSPDCTHFAKARGSKPKDKGIRSLANVGLWYAREVRPRVIVLENVEEFLTWGRLDKRTMQPDKRKKGEGFQKFVRRLRQHGYTVEWKVRRASERGAHTIRKRLFLVARCDGRPIVWTEPTHGPDRAHAYKSAAECIDFSLPTVSIFATQEECRAAKIRARRPMAEATMQRIFRGVQKFVIDNPAPFIIGIDNRSNISAEYSIDDPLPTITGKNRFALAQAFLQKHSDGSATACHIERMHGTSTGESIEGPLSGITGTNHHALVTSHLLSYHSQQGTESRCYPWAEPLPTIDGANRFAEVRAFLIKYYGREEGGHDLRDPLGTITGNDRFGLVMVHGELHQIVDIGLRMLTPAELLKAQFGRFADAYRMEGLTKAKAVKMIGNSVCPTESYDIVKANYVRR